jgi:DNA-binding NtrC family response regulator
MVNKNTTEITDIDEKLQIGSRLKTPGLLAAYSPVGCCAVDRCRVTLSSFSVGRRGRNDLVLDDSKVSGSHFRIFFGPSGFMLEDEGSTNGTFVNGIRVMEPVPLFAGTVIRAGSSVLVFEADAASMLETPPLNRYEMAGSFYIAGIIDKLKETVPDGRHVLLVGETGVGKEPAAHAIAAMLRESGRAISVLEHNCAQYTSEEEADSSIFGVGTRVFSEVDCRSGLIEQAGDGLLFLDEADFLPARIQKSLLRFIEDHQYRRIGESKSRVSHARIVFASNNVDHPTYGLIHDLYPRLCVVRIPSLKERVADIPQIFNEMLRKSLSDVLISENHYSSVLGGKHFEMMCLSGLGLMGVQELNDNVRGLKDVAKRLAAKAVFGKDPAAALNEVFFERFLSKIDRPFQFSAMRPEQPPRGIDNGVSLSVCSEMKPSSHYELYKNLIIETYLDREKRLTPTVRALTMQGLSCTRQHLSKYLKKWGIRE